MDVRSKNYDGVMCTLVNVKTGSRIRQDAWFMHGDRRAQITGGSAPHKPGSTGRAYVRYENGTTAEYFPGVVDAQWMPDFKDTL